MKKIAVGLFLLLLAMPFGLFAEGTKESGSQAPAGTAVPGEASTEQNAQAGEETPAAVSVNVAALRGPTGFGMIRMFDRHPELGAGVSAEWNVIPSPDIMVSRILTGEVDIASLPTNVAAKLAVKGVPYKLGAVTGYGVLYLVSRDSSVSSWADLAGKRVYNIARGSTPDFVFDYLLTKNGLESGKDVTVDFSYGHAELAQAFIAGKVDLAVLPEPFVTKVLMAVPGASVGLDLQKEWAKAQNGEISYPISVVVVKKSLAENHPEVVDRFLAAYRDSIAWVNENPEPAGRLIEQYSFGMSAKEAAVAIPRCNLEFIPAAEAKGPVNDFLSVLLAFDPDSVGGRLPDADFYYGAK